MTTETMAPFPDVDLIEADNVVPFPGTAKEGVPEPAATPAPEPGPVDREQISTFVRAMFPYASEGGTVSLRAFYDDKQAQLRGEKPFDIVSVRLNGDGLDPVIAAAYELAERALKPKRPVVVAPPISTFVNWRAAEKTLMEGLALSVECDERADEAVAFLREFLGPPTIVMESGGEWVSPEGEVKPKKHAHWRLKEPTQTPEEHARLKSLRSLACDLVGSDVTSKNAVHPMRWPGTVHRKNPDAPRLARIVEHNQNAEIVLEDALAELEGLAILRGQAEEAAEGVPRAASGDPTGNADLLLACAERIPNDNLPWGRWSDLGMAFWRASGGSEDGFKAFAIFSRKSAKHDPAADQERWEHWAKSPPDRIGIGTLVREAQKADPSFRKRRKAEVPPDGGFPGTSQEHAGEGAAPEGDWEAKLAAAIEEMNRRYFMVDMLGKSLIGQVADDEAMKRRRLVLSKAGDLKLLQDNRRYVVAVSQKGHEIWRGLGSTWLEHHRRRTYERVALIPSGPVPEGTLNLWQGWGVEPKAGEWPKLHAHILDVLCDGNRENANYLLDWCAHCVQHPERQAGVAVVLRGKKGSGKGTLAKDVLYRIFRHHALQITHSRHLTGNFNAHLMDALFLFLDEAFWGGDKQGEGVLKTLITEDCVQIEPKGVDSFPMPSRLKIMMASNNDWVVPATEDERRYFVLDVSDAKIGDRAYWRELHAALDGGEVAAFLHCLLSHDLSGFEIRDVPHTKGLNRQKLVSADSVTAFWLDCLREGAIYGDGGGEWPYEIPTQRLHAAYLGHAHDHRDRRPDSDGEMVIKLGKLWKGCNVTKKRLPSDAEGRRPMGYVFDTLENHRAAFAKAMNISVEEMGCHE